jgi:hypothetical protein
VSPDEIRDRLTSLAEDLADLALDALRERDEAAERRLTRARRAVEKAAHLLSDNRGDYEDG